MCVLLTLSTGVVEVTRIAFIGLLILAAWLGYRWTFADAAAVNDNAYFYRLKVDLTHKGEPIDLNVVVNCRSRITRHHDGSSASVEPLGTWPTKYAMAINGGHAVAIDTVNKGQFCQGDTTANLKVATNWLPLITWYDRSEDLSFGLGYWSQDAYESPASQLEFHGAVVSKASRQDFMDFLDHGPPNLLPDHMIHWLSQPAPKLPADLTPFIKEPWRAWPYSDGGCGRGALRLKLTPRQKDLVRARWPADHPKFWSVPGDEQTALMKQLYPEKPGAPRYSFQYIRYNRERYPYDFSPNGSDHLDYVDETATPEMVRQFRPQVFPVKDDLGLRGLSAKTRADYDYETEIDIGDGIANRGFVYCEIGVPSGLMGAIIAPPRQEWIGVGGAVERLVWSPFGGWAKNPSCRVDGVDIAPLDIPWGDGSGRIHKSCEGGVYLAFENDEYVITAQ
jgi:hypothetical protein